MLTEKEVNKIFSWLPYREDWPVDRNQNNDNIQGYYGGLIERLTQNKLFDTCYSENGGLGNYLEFICYRGGGDIYEGNAILVCISLCAPVSAYGQTTVHKKNNLVGRGALFSPDAICLISDIKLKEIEEEIKNILADNNLSLIDKEFAGRPLPLEIAESLMHENHNEGSQYLHGIFQKTD